MSSWACANVHKHCLVTMLEFLGPGSAIQPKYWLANQNRGVFNRIKTLKYHSKMARNKIKLKIGCLLSAISSFIILVEDSVSFLVKHQVTIHKVIPEKQLDNIRLE